MVRCYVISVISVFLFACISSNKDLCSEYSNNKEKAQQAIETCTTDMGSGKYEGTDSTGRSGLATRYNNRGIAYGNIGDYDKAIADHNKAIELDPTFAKAYNNRGLDYVNKKDNDRAIVDYSRAIELDPNYVLAYFNRGATYRIKGEYDRAIADYSKVIVLDPTFAQGYLARGNAYTLKKVRANAIADYKKAIEIDPRMIGASYNLACLYSADNNTTEACAWLNKAAAAGFSNWEHIKKDSDLDNIRNAACYKSIMSGK